MVVVAGNALLVENAVWDVENAVWVSKGVRVSETRGW